MIWGLFVVLWNPMLLCRGRDRAHHADVRRRRRHVLARHALGARSSERWFPREHLVEHAGEAVQVAATIHPLAPHRLLRTHVAWRTDCYPGFRQFVAGGGRNRPRDP